MTLQGGEDHLSYFGVISLHAVWLRVSSAFLCCAVLMLWEQRNKYGIMLILVTWKEHMAWGKPCLLSTEMDDLRFPWWSRLHSMAAVTENPQALVVARFVSDTDWASGHCCSNRLFLAASAAQSLLLSSSRPLCQSLWHWVITLVSALDALWCYRSAVDQCHARQLSFKD